MSRTLVEINRDQQESAVIRWRQARALVDRGMTLEDVGVVLGVSKARIWQMLEKLARYEVQKKG